MSSEEIRKEQVKQGIKQITTRQWLVFCLTLYGSCSMLADVLNVIVWFFTHITITIK